MNFFTGLVIGLIAGWVIEWIIDWLFWRKGGDESSRQLAAAEAQIRELRQNNDKLEQELANAQAKINELEAKVASGAAPAGASDRLEMVKGIGAVFAKRFNEAGVYTFGDLAQLSPDRIREIIQPQEWQKIEPEAWIEQAAELATKSGRSRVS